MWSTIWWWILHYSNNWNNRVIVKKCIFLLNTVHAEVNENGKYGASGAYVKSRKGKVKQNSFIDNNGPGSTLTIDNDFKEDTKRSFLLSNESPFVVSQCYFEISQNADSGVFYINGKHGYFVELSDCTFKGYLNKGSHFIDGKSISDDSPKLSVKNCKLLNNDSNNLLFDSKALFIAEKSADTVNRHDLDKSKKKAVIVVTVTAVVAFIAIFGFFIIIKRMNPNLLNEDEMPSDENDI